MTRCLLAYLLIGLIVQSTTAEPEATTAPAIPGRDDHTNIQRTATQTRYHGLCYSRPNGLAMRLDLIVPRRDAPLPLVICVHGGGWSQGNRLQMHPLTKRFVERGYASATISYRLAPKHHFPAAVEDVFAGVRFLRKHATSLNLDPERFGAIGLSAGGHLVGMLGVCDSDAFEGAGEYKGISSRIQAVVSLAGPMEFAFSQLTPAGWKILKRFFGKPRREAVKLYRRGSPQHYVSPEDPPFLLFHGLWDPLVPVSQARQMHAALTQAGVDSTLVVYPKGLHGWLGADLEDTFKKTYAFFDRHLNEGPSNSRESKTAETRPTSH